MKAQFVSIFGIFFLSIGFGAIQAQARDELSFSDIWKHVRAGSHLLESTRLELDAARIGADQGAKHWMPRVYTNIRALMTDDPGNVFFGNLSQRQADPSTDFSVSMLNHPGSSFIQTGTLGFQLPLYDSGTGISQKQASAKIFESKQFEEKAVTAQQYVEAAQSYGQVSILIKRKRDLMRLQDLVEKTLSHYQLGTRSNPVGYSGLLGLKTLKNRIQGVILAFDSKIFIKTKQMDAMSGGALGSWTPEAQNPAKKWELFAFAENFLMNPQSQISPRVASIEASADALQKSVSAEKAKQLPHLGLFAEGNLNHGSRDTATTYNAGAYLTWDLFSPQTSGAGARAQYQADALDARAKAARREETATLEAMSQSSSSIKNGIQLMLESQDFLSEQSEMARTLFLNGSIHVLQMVEVYSRRLDLIEGLAQAEAQFLAARGAQLLSSGFVPAAHAGLGGSNE